MNTLWGRHHTKDIITGGTVTLSGVTTINGAVCPNALVVLMERDSLSIRRAVRSDAAGAYSFVGLAEDMLWTVLAFDPTGTYNAEVLDQVVT